jgi:hypothetical protein
MQDNVCTTLQNTPLDCGMCGHACNSDETCSGGNCVCRQGLSECNGGCVDAMRDANNCGGCGMMCDTTLERCVQGVCTATLCSTLGETNCNGACLTAQDLQSDPLNCGACGKTCQTNQVCAGGQCRNAFPSPYCMTCPCAACGANNTCCANGTTGVICVAGGACPQ